MIVNPIEIIFLPAVFLIGVITSYEDIKTGKIRNKWLLTGLIYGLAAFVCLALWNLVAEMVSQFYYTNIAHIGLNDPRPIFRVHMDFFWKSGLNFFLSLALGFILWKNDILAAGDAKLLSVYTLLIPTSFYWRSYLPSYPGIVLIMNTFVLIFIYFLVVSVVYSAHEHGRRFFGDTAKGPGAADKGKITGNGDWQKSLFMKLQTLSGFTLIILFFYYFRTRAQRLLPVDIGAVQQSFFVLLIVFRRGIARLCSQNKKFYYTIVVLGGIFCAYGLIMNFQETQGIIVRTVKTMVIFMLAMTAMSKVIEVYTEGTCTTTEPVSSLCAGMIIEKKLLNHLCAGNPALAVKVGELTPGGLSDAQAEAIRAAAREQNIESMVVGKRFPLAAWIFGAVIVTLMIKGSLINLVIVFFR